MVLNSSNFLILLLLISKIVSAQDKAVSTLDFDNIVHQLKENLNLNPNSSYELRTIVSNENENYIFEFIQEDETCTNGYIAISEGNTLKYLIHGFKKCDTDLAYSISQEYDYDFGWDGLFVQVTKMTEQVTNKDLVDKNGYLKNGLTRESPGIIITKDTYINSFPLFDPEKELKKYPEINLP